MRNVKRRSRNKQTVLKAVAGCFSLRSAWDVLVVLLLLGVAGYVSHYVQNHPVGIGIPAWPQIRHVEVDGDLHPSEREAFKKIVTAHVSRGFFRIPMDQLEQEIAELPWIYRAQVRRSWPNSLEIMVHMQDPVARWGKSGLMNGYGELFFPESVESYVTLPMLYGDEVRAAELARVFEDSVQRLGSLGLQLQGLFEDDRQSKRLVLSNGVILVVGHGDVGKKITRFITAYEQYLSSHIRQVQKIDLRYTNGLAVEWRDPQLVGSIETEHAL